jgi:hypothetical protein
MMFIIMNVTIFITRVDDLHHHPDEEDRRAIQHAVA